MVGSLNREWMFKLWMDVQIVDGCLNCGWMFKLWMDV